MVTENPEISARFKKMLLEVQDPYLEFGKLEHDYINKHIEGADRKASVTLAVTSVVTVYFIDNSEGLRWLNFKDFDVLCIVAFVSCALLVYSSSLSLMIVYPRLAGDPKGLIFWQSVANCGSAASYADAVLAQSADSLRRFRLMHCYELAVVCTSKFSQLNRSMCCGAVGIILYFVVIFADSVVLLSK